LAGSLGSRMKITLSYCMVSAWEKVRTCLVDAAGVLMTRSKAHIDLKDWGVGLAKRASAATARVAVAGRLSVILLRIWTANSGFQPVATAVAG
jgi:hypothetical protein